MRRVRWNMHSAQLYLSGPTIALSRAAEWATIKRYSHGKEYMFVNRRWRRRRQRAVGPGHGRRRAFGSPDREHARDTGVAETHRDVRRDAIRRRAIGHAIRHRAIWHATTTPDAVTGDGRYRTRRSFFYPTMSGCSMMPGYARICPDDARTMPGYARMPDSPDDARYRLAAGSVRRLRDGMRAAQRQLSAAPLASV